MQKEAIKGSKTILKSSIIKSSFFKKKRLPVLEFEDRLAEILYFYLGYMQSTAANKIYIKCPSDIQIC